MIKQITGLVVAGLFLTACGSVSASSAMVSWAQQSNFVANAKVLYIDSQHSATALRKLSESSAGLHTVCAVLLVDAEAANSSLPTPDAQSTRLLSKAYSDLGAGANQCYRADHSNAARAMAIAWLIKGAATFSEATARVASASLP